MRFSKNTNNSKLSVIFYVNIQKTKLDVFKDMFSNSFFNNDVTLLAGKNFIIANLDIKNSCQQFFSFVKNQTNLSFAPAILSYIIYNKQLMNLQTFNLLFNTKIDDKFNAESLMFSLISLCESYHNTSIFSFADVILTESLFLTK